MANSVEKSRKSRSGLLFFFSDGLLISARNSAFVIPSRATDSDHYSDCVEHNTDVFGSLQQSFILRVGRQCGKFINGRGERKRWPDFGEGGPGSAH